MPVSSSRVAAAYAGNPGAESIYPVQVDHGYDEPLAGGTDVMRKLQNRLLTEQGREPRPESSRLAAGAKPKAPQLRKPYYAASDGVSALLDVAKTDPMIRKDRELQPKANALKDALYAFHDYISANYIWD